MYCLHPGCTSYGKQHILLLHIDSCHGVSRAQAEHGVDYASKAWIDQREQDIDFAVMGFAKYLDTVEPDDFLEDIRGAA